MLEDIDSDPGVIADLFARQRPRAQALRESTVHQRRATLGRLKDALMARRAAFHEAFALDLRKHAVEVDLTELLPVLEEIAHTRRHLAKWMRPRRVWPTLTTLGTSAKVVREPLGRCLVIGPWNYPVSTLLGPLVSAVAAGNTVVLKPSEMTPHVNAVIAELVAAVFEPDEVGVVRGGVRTSQQLLALPFDHVFFTGSPAVGKIVMAAAAKHLASVTLELGGKSPVIVDETADLELAARLVLWGKLTNAGQTCVAPDHVFVHHRVKERFVRLCTEILAARYGVGDDAVAASADLGRMINERHAARVGALIDDAVARGAAVVAGGRHDAATRYVAPTILADVPRDASISTEEIFGPVLPVIGFDSLDAVLREIDDAPKPLALYMWSRDRRNIEKAMRRTSSGGFGLNHCVQQFAHPNLPFGGVNNSGLGNSHGEYGFKAFSHERAVLAGGPLMAVGLFFPPFTSRTRRLSATLLRLLAWR